MAIMAMSATCGAIDGTGLEPRRTIKDATVKRYHYDDPDQLRHHLADFVAAYNFARPSEDPQRPHAIRVRLKMLDFRARPIQTQPTPSNAGTEHLVSVVSTALAHRLLIDAVTSGKRSQALFTMLYRSTDRLSRRGAPVKNLAHSASFDSCNKNAPSKCGTKQQLGGA